MGAQNDFTPEQHALVAQHGHLIDEERGRRLKTLPPDTRAAAREPLTEAGKAALLMAAWRFESARGVPFGAYARRRIKGAMIDALREMDWLPRYAHNREGAPKVGGGGAVAGGAYNMVAVGRRGYSNGTDRVDAAEAIEAILQQLPDDDSRLLRLRFFQHLTCRDVASMVAGLRGKPVMRSRISQLTTRALAAARQIAADLGVENCEDGQGEPIS